MKRFAPLFLLLALLGSAVKAQMLETVDMSDGAPFSTYLTGINNSGYVTGYFFNGSNNVGFIITPTGKKLQIEPSQVGGLTDSKVDGINDNGVAVVTANTGTTVGIYRCYLDTLGDSIHHLVQVTGLTQPSSVAFDISNNNDIAGWFQSGYRYLWVKHDSIVPGGNIPFESAVFESSGPTYYNTMVGGVNDANKVAGFYIDGSNYEPFVYNNIGGTWDLLAITNKCKLWDINNNNWVAGEFLQMNSVWMGFIANVSTGNFTQFTSLKTIFDDSTIQSVANGINDQGHVAGSFLHPTSGQWVGYIYRPGSNEVRIPGFAFNTGTWKLNNNGTTVPQSVWPQSYWGGFNYSQSDPYVTNGTPLIDNNILNTFPNLTMPNFLSVDWISFCKETDLGSFGDVSDLFLQNYYHAHVKPVLFAKYKVKADTFNGHCYGFTYSELLHHFDDALFSAWFDIPAGTNISQEDNTNILALQAIARSYLKQSNLATISKYATAYYQDESFWSGLHELKMEYMKPFDLSNPRSISFNMPSGFHSVLPYKIRSPKTLPFDEPTLDQDTIYVHDSNFPEDSSQFILAQAHFYYMPYSAVWNANYNINYLSFNKASVREFMETPYTLLKSTSAGDDPALTFALDGPSYYIITTGSGNATSNISGYNNNTTELLPLNYEAQTPKSPIAHMMDTTYSAQFSNYNYVNPAMSWIQHNKRYSLSLSRVATSSETDHGEIKNRRFSYGNPDNNTKYLNGGYSEITDDQQLGVTIIAQNICAEQGDSIMVRNPHPFAYEIVKVEGNANCTYNLTVLATYNGDEIREFHSDIELSGTTSHIIDPYFAGNDGTQIAVIVDNGVDGIADDTLFVTGWPVNMPQTISGNNGIKVYPNPVEDELNIEFAVMGSYNIMITDIVGKTLYSQSISANRSRVAVGQLPVGVYLIQIADEKGNMLMKDKIIKQ
jgi:hypothetical protein